MKRFFFSILFLFVFTQAGASENTIVVDREWESSNWMAYQVLSRVRQYDHIIVMIGDAEPESIRSGSLEYFISQAHRMGKRVSISLNVTDGTDAVFYPGYPDKIAAYFSSYAKKYSADGINLDSARTRYDHGICDTPFCRNDFVVRYGIDLNAVIMDVPYYGWLTKYRAIMTDWNGKVLTAAIQAIHDAVRTVKPTMQISVDSYSHPYWEMEGALPEEWINVGLVDHYYVMDYADQPTKEDYPKIDNSKFTIILGAFYRFNNKGGWIDMYSRDPTHVEWLKKSIEGIGDGYAIYSYRFLR
jgi:hypothetical protein